MRSLFRKTHKGQKGFTLVELLVVFTLLGVLAAIILPSTANILEKGHQAASDTEKSVLQSAVDAFMAVTNNSTMAVTAATNDMTDFPTGVTLYPDYLRTSTTVGTYSCAADGTVTRVTSGYSDVSP